MNDTENEQATITICTTDTCASPTSTMIENTKSESSSDRKKCLVCLDSDIGIVDSPLKNSLNLFKTIFNNIQTFSNPADCAKFINQENDLNIFMIVSETFAQQILSEIHRISQLNSVYLFCRTQQIDKQWMTDWPKIQSVHNDIDSLCKSIEDSLSLHAHDSVPITITSVSSGSKQKLDQLDSKFMYTQLFKEILFEIDYKDQTIKDFADHCRKLYADDPKELKNIDKFEQEYQVEKALWWYTYECFLYRMLNKALREQEIGNLIKLGFFIRDLHRQLEIVHAEQYGSDTLNSFTVYRGQSLSTEDFEKILQTPGGLLSFNNFLSTSVDPKVSLNFGKNQQAKPGRVSILFEMTIDTSVKSSPFALLDQYSYFKDAEREILFSTHTIFRIGKITSVDDSKTRWRVELTLTHDNDQEIHAVTQCMREETKGSTGWHRLGVLLMKVGEYSKAEDIYNMLLNRKELDDSERAYLSQHLGWAKRKQGDYEYALCCYEKAREIRESRLSKDHPDLIYTYNSIGDTFKGMGDYTKALSNYERALQICKKRLPENDSQLATTNNNIGDLYNYAHQYSKALPYYQTALGILEKTLPPYHPELATLNNNIGNVYNNLEDYETSLRYYDKVLEIGEKTLRQNHPDFAIFYNNIGATYDALGEYSKALSYYEKALQNAKDTLPENHPNLVNFYNSIGQVWFNMGDFSKALIYYENALEVCKNTLPNNHPNLATSYNNIGLVYLKKGEFEKALSYYKLDLQISEKSPELTGLDLAPTYNSMGLAYFHMGKYSEALLQYEKAFDLCQNYLPENHSNFASCYKNIGNVYKSLNEYSKALSYYEKQLDICEKSLPRNHPHFANVYSNIGSIHEVNGDYSNALSFLERAIECANVSLPESHPDLQMYHNNLEELKNKIKP